MEEIWKWVDGYQGFYKVSNLGHVKSVDRYVYCEVSPNKLQHLFGKVLKSKIDKKGYAIVYLSKEGKQKKVLKKIKKSVDFLIKNIYNNNIR